MNNYEFIFNYNIFRDHKIMLKLQRNVKNTMNLKQPV